MDNIIIYELNPTTGIPAPSSFTLPVGSPTGASKINVLRSYKRFKLPKSRTLGFALIAIALGGMIGPLFTQARLEASYHLKTWSDTTMAIVKPEPQLPPATPHTYNPLTAPDGSVITPINTDFAIIVPKIGINAPIVASVDPAKPSEYQTALKMGVAHAKTSFLPSENGTTYLFSHSTNYEWFVKDLNAIFYLMSKLEADDTVVVIYKNRRYTYKIREKKVVSPKDVSYLVPFQGKKSLILQTCWPPGSVAQRLLLFADFVEEQAVEI